MVRSRYRSTLSSSSYLCSPMSTVSIASTSSHSVFDIIPSDAFNLILHKLGGLSGGKGNLTLLSLLFVSKWFKQRLEEEQFVLNSDGYLLLGKRVLEALTAGKTLLFSWVNKLFPSRLEIVMPRALVIIAGLGDLPLLQSLQGKMANPELTGKALSNFLLNTTLADSTIPTYFLDSIAEEAALNGHLHILKWMKSSCTLYEPCYLRKTTLAAARGGHLHILKWLRVSVKNCDWGAELVDNAFCGPTTNSQVELVLWLKRNSSDKSWEMREDSWGVGKPTQVPFSLLMTQNICKKMFAESYSCNCYEHEVSDILCKSSICTNLPSGGRQRVVNSRIEFVTSLLQACGFDTAYAMVNKLESPLDVRVKDIAKNLGIVDLTGLLFPYHDVHYRKLFFLHVEELLCTNAGSSVRSPHSRLISFDIDVCRARHQPSAYNCLRELPHSAEGGLAFNAIRNRDINLLKYFEEHLRRQLSWGFEVYYFLCKDFSLETCKWILGSGLVYIDLSRRARTLHDREPLAESGAFQQYNIGRYTVDNLTSGLCSIANTNKYKKEIELLSFVKDTVASLSSLLAIASTREDGDLFIYLIDGYKSFLADTIDDNLICFIVRHANKDMVRCLHERNLLFRGHTLTWSMLRTKCPKNPRGRETAAWLEQKETEDAARRELSPSNPTRF